MTYELMVSVITDRIEVRKDDKLVFSMDDYNTPEINTLTDVVKLCNAHNINVVVLIEICNRVTVHDMTMM